MALSVSLMKSFEERAHYVVFNECCALPKEQQIFKLTAIANTAKTKLDALLDGVK